ncbi:hypothetical protein SBOR_2242 [Sclerotinia borealis F-4128]|uniref:Uncharacterized protein n=1 Tax=Sclerotinia borealis (strain F-4128) TaxID=1432307 RepID=W9CMW4_SCLBF|nr:hypothetical protein SBOR_2242 [Sclerotinia borealis F-4128]
MSGLFKKSRHNAPASPASPAIHSQHYGDPQCSSDRLQQESRHSETTKGDTSYRPHLFRSKTWQISSSSKESLATDGLSPKLSKSPKLNGSVKSFFSTKSRKSSDEEDDSDDEFWQCKGKEGTGMLEGDGKSNRKVKSRQPVYINTPSPIPIPIPSRYKPKAVQIQRGVSTRKNRKPSKSTILSSRTSSKDPSASRTTEASSVLSSAYPRSPYGNSTAASSFLDPRSITSVYNQREHGKINSTGGSNSDSDLEEEHRGRDSKNLRRERSKYLEAQRSENSISFTMGNKDKIKSKSQTYKTLESSTSSQDYRRNGEKRNQRAGSRIGNDDRFYYHEERDYAVHDFCNKHKFSATRTGSNPSAQGATITNTRGDKNKALPKLPIDAQMAKPHYDYTEHYLSTRVANHNSERVHSKTGPRRLKYYESYEGAHQGWR